jgi:hypothetical protein
MILFGPWDPSGTSLESVSLGSSSVIADISTNGQ